MLGKLLKYEIKSTARIFLPLYPLVLALALINRLLFVLLRADNFVINTARFVSVSAYVIGLMAVFFLTFIVMIQRFYKNLLKEEGYLSFTLPVSTSSHILSKLIVSCLWTLSSTIIAILSFLLVIPKYEFLSEIPEYYKMVNTEFFELFGYQFGWMIVIIILYMFIGTIVGILMIYASMAIGHLGSKNRVLLSFGAYFALYFISQTLSTVFLSIFGYNFENYAYNEFPVHLMNIILISSFVLSIVMGVGYFIVTKKILDKKLNIE